MQGCVPQNICIINSTCLISLYTATFSMIITPAFFYHRCTGRLSEPWTDAGGRTWHLEPAEAVRLHVSILPWGRTRRWVSPTITPSTSWSSSSCPLQVRSMVIHFPEFSSIVRIYASKNIRWCPAVEFSLRRESKGSITLIAWQDWVRLKVIKLDHIEKSLELLKAGVSHSLCRGAQTEEKNRRMVSRVLVWRKPMINLQMLERLFCFTVVTRLHNLHTEESSK